MCHPNFKIWMKKIMSIRMKFDSLFFNTCFAHIIIILQLSRKHILISIVSPEVLLTCWCSLPFSICTRITELVKNMKSVTDWKKENDNDATRNYPSPSNSIFIKEDRQCYRYCYWGSKIDTKIQSEKWKRSKH